MKIVFIRMNAAPASRLAGLVGGVVIRGPLKIDGSAGAEIDLQGVRRDGVMMEAAGEIAAACDQREYFGGGTRVGAGLAQAIAEMDVNAAGAEPLDLGQAAECFQR